ncbi:MAG: hypothetical protein PWP27_2430 [Clostridiales bacterium]|jgi:hypothetical protein|nr:hypothetical protein [Clostridiales bacterium]MDK2934620.1 hypothetical protein [Clostridiales bacterium]
MEPITLDYLFRINEKEFLTVIPGWQLVEYWDDNTISYNPEIQRGSRIKKKRNNEEVEEAVYSKANVKKIYKSMVAGNYFVDMITLNVLDDGNSSISEPFYDETNEGRAVNITGQIEIADGQHRIRALKMLNDSNEKGITNIPLESFIFPVKITHYDLKTAQQQFHQFSKGLKISSSRSEYFNATDHSNEIVRQLMRNSELTGRVEIVRNTITKRERRNVVTFATMVNAIKMVYKEMTNAQAQELAGYLCEFFDGLFNTVPELLDFESRQQSKETSLKAENFMFYGYLAISKLLRGKENWQQYLPLINELDLAKESEVWFGKVTKRGRNGFAIINSTDSRAYFIEKITEQFEQLLQNQ